MFRISRNASQQCLAALLRTRAGWCRRGYSTHAAPPEKKISLLDIKKKYTEDKPITMVTAYDYTSAYFVDKANVDVILVGDSLGMVMMGRNNTTEVTMDEMLHHCKAVARGTKRAFVVGDMPFGSFEVSPIDATRNAIRLVKEGLVSAVKLEGGKSRKETVKAIVEAGIPVIGHIGLTPQTSAAFGGFRVHGKSAQDAAAIYEDALALQDAGCSALVIEFVPELLGQAITSALNIPTFGIGAGRYTSGQVLVYHDMLGMYPDFTPKFCKKFANVGEEISKGLAEYKQEVEARQFPAPAHTFSMKAEEWEQAQRLIAERDQASAAKLEPANGRSEGPNGKASELFDKLAVAAQAAAKISTGSGKGNIEKSTSKQPKKWEITNFDLYYNSYIQNNSDTAELEFDHPNGHTLKLKN